MRGDATAPSVCMYVDEHCVRTIGCRFDPGLEPSGAKTLGMRYSSEPCCYVVLKPDTLLYGAAEPSSVPLLPRIVLQQDLKQFQSSQG